jgi:hypothetical protein
VKILIIGHFQKNNYTYPHLGHVMDKMSNYTDVCYYYFPENFFMGLLSIPRLLIKFRDVDAILAVNCYIYVVSTMIFRTKKIFLWSFDFIDERNQTYNTPRHRILIKAVQNSFSKHKKIIIQDKERLNVYLKSYHLEDIPNVAFFLPVSVPDVNSTSLRHIKPRIMQLGFIHSDRYSDQLLEHYQKNYGYYDLFLKGYSFPDFISIFKKYEVQPFFSTLKTHYKYMYTIVDYCDIGFIGYKNKDNNHYYIAQASGQLVEFLRLGKPIISIGDTNLNPFIEENSIGIIITSMNQLQFAIDDIMVNYDKYSENCRKTFKKDFLLDNYIEKLVKWLMMDIY